MVRARSVGFSFGADRKNTGNAEGLLAGMPEDAEHGVIVRSEEGDVVLGRAAAGDVGRG